MPKLKGADLRVAGPVAGAPQWLTEDEIRHLVDNGRVVVMWPDKYAHGLDEHDLRILARYRTSQGEATS